MGAKLSKKDRVIHEETKEDVNGLSLITLGIFAPISQQVTTLTLDDGTTVTGKGSTVVESKVDAYKKMDD